VLSGITTTGVVLSTVRQAAGLDFSLVVLEDLCFDSDEQAHSLLMDNIFPRQSQVASSADYMAQL